MNNHRKRVFRIRHNKGGFRRRNGGQNQNPQLNSFNFNRSFNKNGSMSNPVNIEKAIQKFNQLAKDAQSTGDLILVQNYLQHADHYSRMLSKMNSGENKEESSQDKNLSSNDKQNKD
tara:strand:- start:742 stop:1092 length:351 start_codon:yes stop_codon:yes gene_type:complete